MSVRNDSKAKGPEFWMSLISLVLTVVGVPIMFLAWIEPHLENDQRNEIKIEVGDQLKDPLAKMDETNKHLTAIESSLDELKPFIHDVIDRQFENVSKLPIQALVERLPAVSDLLKVAEDQHVKTNPTFVTGTGIRLLRSSAQYPAAWEAALNFVKYRSFLNEEQLSALGSFEVFDRKRSKYSPTFRVKSFSTQQEESDYFTFLIQGNTPSAEDSARLEDLKFPLQSPSFLRVIALDFRGGGHGLIIDNTFMKNVVVRNAIVEYDGGPVRLENVLFVNCRFIMSRRPAASNLALALLSEEPATTYSNGPATVSSGE